MLRGDPKNAYDGCTSLVSRFSKVGIKGIYECEADLIQSDELVDCVLDVANESHRRM